MNFGRTVVWTDVVLVGAAMLVFSGPVSAQSGAIFWDRRGANGTCCRDSNGSDGAPATDNFILTQSGLNISATGSAGVTVDVSGGNGGDGAEVSTSQNHWGGNGGYGRIIDYTVQSSSILSTAGAGLVGVSKGGDGGKWGDGKDHGNGADGHAVLLTLTGSTIFAAGYGISAVSMGGTGQESAIATFGAERNAGNGGNAGEVRVTLNGNSALSVGASARTGAYPNELGAGIGAQSIGGQGGPGVHTGDFGGHSYTGRGGAAGNITVTTQDGTSISTRGDRTLGILARSTGGDALTVPSGDPVDVAAANGGDAGLATVTNGAWISTSGTMSPGILAASTGGNGSNGGPGSWGSGHNGGAGGTPQGVVIANTGSISTSGVNSNGITAIVKGGSGGIGGASGISGHGGDGGAGASTRATAIQINNSGSITTSGQNSTGILAHAVGGGGGASAASNGAFFVGGGNGGNAGTGGVLDIANSGGITTGGDHSDAILLQSIGGGGGAGGDADSTGVITAMAIGGRGGAAGGGGNISLKASGRIVTTGAGSSGLTLQSIGGGGGEGGSASAVSVGVLTGVAMSIGGNGGGGGQAGGLAITLDQNGGISTAGALGNAVVAQAIGGGGGNGAFADSTQATIAPDLGPEMPSGAASIQHTVGGSGGTGGMGGTIGINTSGQLATTGARAFGILAQSIGGGGGNGGTAAAPLRPTVVGASDISISAGITVGGNGGAGGQGTTVNISNRRSGAISTTGDQSIGVLAQSIGGGGGSGGLVQEENSHSFSPTMGSPQAFLGAVNQVANWLETAPTGLKLASFTYAVDARVGGDGAGGGNGGDITLTNDGRVVTSGASAPAIVAQSIAGGGGQGGAINSSGVSSLLSSIDSMVAAASGAVSGAFSLSPNIGLNMAIGGLGGFGGNGGSVTINNTGTVATSAFASPAVLAQSIGGGGGTGTMADQSLEAVVKQQGGASAEQILDRITTILDLLGSKGLSMARSVAVNVGGSNGADGNGGPVLVDASAGTSSISTRGGASPAVLAQSVGGGGGTADVSTDAIGAGGFSALAGGAENPLSIALGATRTFTPMFQGDMNGGTVTVLTGGAIRTQGNDSVGVLTQSVSGGGGVALVNVDSSAATSLGADRQRQSPSISLGGKLSREDYFTATPHIQGGDVTVKGKGDITTTGTLSHAIVAQSVGGGGGIASLALSPQAGALLAAPNVSLGVTSGQFGAPTGGGAVKVTLDGAASTSGNLAFGVLAQSIGNGGGYVALTSAGQAYAGPTTLTFGGGGDSSGSGGAASVVLNGAVRTAGQDSHGIVAQSVGGGGGIAGLTTQPGTLTLHGTSANELEYSNGGQVTVKVAAGGHLETAGRGAIGILAQSVGGGGGIAGDAASVNYGLGMVQRSDVTSSVGSGGSVAVNVGCAPGETCAGLASVVATSGANAPAILAMSLGGGAVFRDGGVFLNTPPHLNPSSPINAGAAVEVNLHAGATVSAMGAGSPAIAAISMGSRAGGDALLGSAVDISIDKGANVMADRSSGIGILAITTDVTTINNAGTVSGRTAIATDRQTVVNNDGLIAGNVDIGRGSGIGSNFNNRAGATFQSGDNLYITWGALNNAGTLSPGGPGVFTTTRLTYGKFNQTSSGTLAADLDFANRKSDRLSSSEASYFGGTVTPLTQNPVRDTALTIIHSDPVIPAHSVELSVADRSPVFAYPLRISEDKHDVLISVNANFRPQGIALNSDQAAVAGHLQALWDTGSVKAAPLFGTLTGIKDSTAYVHALGTIASDVSLARASGRGQENYAFLNRLMSCPSFVDGSTRLAEGECTWGRVLGASADRSTTSEDVGYRRNQAIYQIGTQKKIAPDWFFGGSLNYTRTHTTSSDHTVAASSDGVQGGITLKRQAGSWQFAGALLAGYESSTQTRSIVLPGFFASATGKPEAYFGGARARVSDQIDFDTWYLKPYVDLDATYERNSAYRETGAGLFDLAYRSTGSTTWMATPSVEIGGRVDLDDATLRPYLAFGVSSVLSGDAKVSVSLAEFPMQPFQITSNMPKVYGDVTAGLELLKNSGWEFRAEYRLRAAKGYVDQSAMLRLARHF